VSDPLEVLLQFAFLAVLYLFLLWVARSARRDLGRPAADPYGEHEPGSNDARPYSGRLVVERGAGLAAGGEYGVGPGLAIGRAAGNEIRIDDSFASSRHARLYDRDGVVFIEDMNSTNGTYVNGRRLGAQQALRPSDRITIGDTEFRFEQ
jgi:hypothetical protein